MAVLTIGDQFPAYELTGVVPGKLADIEATKPEDYFTTVVSIEDIASNDYNIAVSSYVEAEDTREAVNITELNAEIARIVARQAELRTAIDEIVADLEGSK